jgi:hypothetical protein
VDSPVIMVVIQNPSQRSREGPCRPEDMTLPDTRDGSRLVAQALCHQAVSSLGAQVRQQDRECLAHDAPPVSGDAVGTQGQTGTFKIHQLTAGQVDGDLLRMLLPATGGPPAITGRASLSGPEQLSYSRQAYPS